VAEFKRENVKKLLTYLTKLKETGHEEKFKMDHWLYDIEEHDPVGPDEVTNWHCGTAGCLAGSWYIILKQEDEDCHTFVEDQFNDDFGLEGEESYYVTSGRWSPLGLNATIDEAIAYLTLSLTRGSLVPEDTITW
jgi:hypothetical protein